MRELQAILAITAALTIGCGPSGNRGASDGSEQFCRGFQQLEIDALEVLRFEYPVEVAGVSFAWCACASISLADANGDMEHFRLTWPLLEGFEKATLHYNPQDPEGTVVNDYALVEASLVLMGSWVTRTFSLDEIAQFATTKGPKGCKTHEPEMMARVVLDLANQPRYSRLVEAIVCGDEDSSIFVQSPSPVGSPRIQVRNLAETSKPRPTRIPGLLLRQQEMTANEQQ